MISYARCLSHMELVIKDVGLTPREVDDCMRAIVHVCGGSLPEGDFTVTDAALAAGMSEERFNRVLHKYLATKFGFLRKETIQ